ncbi:MAG: asparagine synthase (glutamine-hydrolyzing), partial [Chloroflexia bacterium]
MCGICGIWNLNRRPVAPDEIHAMANALAHRGPDGEGYYLDGPLALGHRRLSILDLTPTGNQPMDYANGRYWITYNGEIYNFLELRAELEQQGYAFRSESDTEVILAAYAAWGPDCLLRFNGMWALAIWDSLEKRLFLARDRFGIKPLYYLHRPDLFAFASEMKAFLRLAGFVSRANLPVLKAELLDVHSQEGGEDCLLEEVHRLLPGSYLQVDADGQLRTHKWWHTRDHLPDVPDRFEDQVEHFRLLFEDACRLRLRSDVPIATCLSGGIDSSAVVCTVAEVAKQGTARIAPGWQRAFVATFPGASTDERRFAEAVVQKTGIVPIIQEIRVEDALPYTEDTVFHLEEIYTTPLWPLWLLYRRLRQEHTIVTLDGHGGDELLAGYDHYVIAALYDAGSRHGSPSRYLQLLHTYAAMRAGGADVQQWRGLADLLWDTASPLRFLRRLLHRTGLLGMRRLPDLAASWMRAELEQMPC